MSLNVRQAGWRDLEAVDSLRRLLLLHEWRSGAMGAGEITEDLMAVRTYDTSTWLHSDQVAVFLAEESSRPVGFVVAQRGAFVGASEASRLIVPAMYVRKRYRKGPVPTLLFRAVSRLARALRASEVQFIHRPGNRTAGRLYRKHAQKVGTVYSYPVESAQRRPTDVLRNQRLEGGEEELEGGRAERHHRAPGVP